MPKSLFFPVLLSSFLLTACNASETASAAPGQSAPKKIAKKNLKDMGSACEVFSAAEIKGFFKIAESTELKVAEAGQTFPACSYEWGKGLVVRKITAGGKDIEIKEPAKVMLVVAQGVTAANFKASTSIYKDAESIAGVGEMAQWGAARSQLTFLANQNLFHINVKANSAPAENKRMAIELSKLLMQKI